MRTNYLFSLLALTSLSLVHLHGEDPAPDEPCGSTPKPMRVTTRHIEGNGIGYNKGYTTIEGFFAPYKVGNWTPFLDVRGHVLNDGQLAANAGLGVRYLTDSRIWGMNTYYDYRNSNHQHYNQVALGLESLGKIWDFRVNGYLPVGDKTSSSYDWDFDKYVGYNILLKGKREFVMKGLSSEAGFHIDHFKKLPIYFAAGPYYLEGKGKNVWGGQLRGALDLAENIRLEGNTSYDNVFKWVGQGQVSLIIPFGHKKKVNQKKDRSCSTALALEKRALQKVDRFEIIPVSRERRTALAVDPATGQTQVVFHVDPSGNSNGTAASPFHTVSAALALAKPRDSVLVGPGTFDAQEEGEENGFRVGSGVSLLSTTVQQRVSTQYGRMSLPVTKGSTVLTNSRDNTENDTTVTKIIGDYAEVVGFSFIGEDLYAGISSDDETVANAHIASNTFDIASQSEECYGIEVRLSGISVIEYNEFKRVENDSSQATNYAYGIQCRNYETETTVTIAHNTFRNIMASDPYGVAYGYQYMADGYGNLISHHNKFYNINSPIYVQNTGNNFTTNIYNETITGTRQGNSNVQTAIKVNNVYDSYDNAGINCRTSVANCVISDLVDLDIAIQVIHGATSNGGSVVINSNTITNITSDTLISITGISGTCATSLEISSNEISNIILSTAYTGTSKPAVTAIQAISGNAVVNANTISVLTSDYHTSGITFGYSYDDPAVRNVFSSQNNTINGLKGNRSSTWSFETYIGPDSTACWQITDNVIENNGYIENNPLGEMSYLYVNKNNGQSFEIEYPDDVTLTTEGGSCPDK